MTNIATNSDPSPDAATSAAVDPVLDCCGHLESAHDAVAKRFCAATQRGSLTRGCICHSHTGAQKFR
jgi:hypothetical protein